MRSHDPTLIEDNVATTVRNDDGSFTLTLESDGSAPTANAVLIATGARSKRDVCGGRTDHWGRGVSFSSISHAQHFAGRGRRRHRRAARLGGRPGTGVSRPARQLGHPRLGASVRLPGAGASASHPAVSIFSNWEVQAIAGDDFVTAIQLAGITAAGAGCRLKACSQLELLPNNDMVRGLVDFDERGHIASTSAVRRRCRAFSPRVT
ncbi:MAG: hypothetical protein R3A10_09455 [Caldilineaceae bacterium]